MAALSESQLSVDGHLDVFGYLRGCSLARNAFLAFTQKSALKHVFGSFRRLTVSLSAPSKAAMEHQSRAATVETESQTQSGHLSILWGIMQVSHIMLKLENIDFHWYNLGDGASTPPLPSASRQENNIHSASPHLKDCSLRGIYATESNLPRFLEAVNPATVTLTDVHLVSGTYDSIFKYLTDPYSPVSCYYLDDIREGETKLVHFEVPGSLKFRYTRGDIGPSLLTRQASHVKEAIYYRLPPGRPLGAGERMRWLKRKFQEFGPPKDGVYSFIELNSQKFAAAPDDSDDG